MQYKDQYVWAGTDVMDIKPENIPIYRELKNHDARLAPL